MLLSLGASLRCGPQPLGLDDEVSEVSEVSGDTSESAGSSGTGESSGGDCIGAERVIADDVVVTSAEDFASLADVVEIQGDLRISETTIVELVGANCLERIGGTLEIADNPQLERIDDAFTRLVEITNPNQPTDTGLVITENPALVSLTGLRELVRIDDRVLLTDNPMLIELRFDGLDSVGESLSISLTSLESLEGLAALREVEGRLSIEECDALLDLEGLSALEQLGSELHHGGLDIGDNASLLTLHGLALTDIPKLTIEGNPLLVDLAGLESVTTIGSAAIADNLSLASLHGLDNLVALNGDDTVLDGLSLVRNPALSDLGGLESVDQISGHLHLCDNATLGDLSALDDLPELGRLTVTYNDALDEDVAWALADAIPSSPITKIAANGPLVPPWWDAPTCAWAGDLVCDAGTGIFGDAEVSCEEDCCALDGPTHLCGDATDGTDCSQGGGP